MAALQPVNLADKFSRFRDHWSPKIVAALNDYDVKLVKLQGDFPWHSHEDTDELFYVVQGEMTIELRAGTVTLAAGDLYVVPRGVEHRPAAGTECQVMLFEPHGVANTGDAGGELTSRGEWL